MEKSDKYGYAGERMIHGVFFLSCTFMPITGMFSRISSGGGSSGGNLQQVLRFIERSVKRCHVELTTLIVPKENDSEEEMREMTAWISGLTDDQGSRIGQNIPLHISRFFPQFHMKDRPATNVRLIYRLADIARERLKYVYTGNC